MFILQVLDRILLQDLDLLPEQLNITTANNVVTCLIQIDVKFTQHCKRVHVWHIKLPADVWDRYVFFNIEVVYFFRNYSAFCGHRVGDKPRISIVSTFKFGFGTLIKLRMFCGPLEEFPILV